MKKLLLLLFYLTLSFNSYGETYNCSGFHKELDEVQTSIYKRVGNTFYVNTNIGDGTGDGWPVDSFYENNKSLFLTDMVGADSSFVVTIIDKKSKKFRHLIAEIDGTFIFTYIGKCFKT